MEQEVRSSDIFTMLASMIDSHPHGTQNSQSNNNNSNPVSTLGTSTLVPNSMNSTLSSMSEGTQIPISTTQTTNSINVQLLDIPNQPPSVPNGPDAEMAELERISSTFMSQNFPVSSTASSSVAETLIYDASSHVGMSDEVGNNIDYPRNSLDFGMSSNQVLLEALSSMDKDNFSGASGQSNGPNGQSGLRTEATNGQNVSLAQSFVSLLSHHSQVDPCNVWPINTVQNNFNTVPAKTRSNTSNNMPMMPTIMNEHPNMYSQTSNGIELAAAPAIQSQHSIYNNTMSCKVAKHQQHSAKAPGNTHYAQTDLLRYGQEKHKGGNNGAMLGTEKGVNVDITVKDRSKEKRLTTTPIPSDADKSSSCCSSSSSGSVSGPEQSPDHVTEQTNSVRRQQHQENNFNNTMNKPHRLGNVAMQHTTADNGMKGYPCLSNVGTMNFGTINFTPVMDNSTRSIPEIHNENRKSHISSPGDIHAPQLPTSDSIVEIDETVSSPLENIPVSPCTPTAEHGDMLPTSKQGNPNNVSNVNSMNATSYGRLQMMNRTALANQGSTNGRNALRYGHDLANNDSSTKKLENSRRSMPGQKDHKAKDLNNNHSAPVYRNKSGSNVGYDAKLKEKQRKPRNSKQHRQKNDVEQASKSKNEEEYRSIHFNTTNAVLPGQSIGQSGLIPKVNADPTIAAVYSINKSQDASVRNNLATSQNFCRSSLPVNVDYNQMSATLPSHQLSHANQNMPAGRRVSNHTSSAMPQPVSIATAPTPSVRQWQTVTAVQVPKMPPMLSEQDRIPKRGRPSKKMMQQNLKVKKDATQQNAKVSSTVNSTSGSFETTNKSANTAPSEAISNQNKLVSMYTINDKGLVEEIAPKPKENRRSKERTQAFLKLLDDIKSSKQQVTIKPKFGEKAKSGPEKLVKKRSKPRAKVFGRGVSQPLTETGITETMFTFSALAHQYKISNSIVSRATENLLKSVAMKRSKEQSLTNISSADGDKHLPGMNANKKGVSVSHCDVKISTSSKVMVPSTQLLPSDPSKPSQGVSITNAAQSRLLQTTSSKPISASVAVAPTLEMHQTKEAVPVLTNAGKVETRLSDVVTTQSTPDVSQGEIIQLDKPQEDSAPAKSKQRKKKHKKHKKHKNSENKLGSGKKKKKDKERKKKSKKKVKTKIGPSTSVSVVKPPYQDKSNQSAVMQNKDTLAVSGSTVPNLENSFTSGFRQSSDQDESTLWPTEDNVYEEDDSSSDEAGSTVPVPYTQATVNKTPTAASTSTMSSFAQYSNSTLDFGMFSNQKPKATAELSNQNTQKSSKEAEVLSPGTTFSASTGMRPKKHHKHKKKKFPRKSKSSCDPKLLAALEKIVVNIKDLKLECAPVINRSLTLQTPANIFFATSISDSPQPSLWRISNNSSFSSSKSDVQQAGIVKDTSFKRDNSRSNRKSQSSLNYFIPNTKPTPVSTPNTIAHRFTNANTLSVFCSSPFFQKYGYVSKFSQVSSTVVATVSTCRPAIVQCSTGQVSTQPRTAPCISTNVLLESPSISEKVQEPVAVTKSNDSLHEDVLKLEKRKRGWPRGRPRGPRPKKSRLAHAESSTQLDSSPARETTAISTPDTARKQKDVIPKASSPSNRPVHHINAKQSGNGEVEQKPPSTTLKVTKQVDKGSNSAQTSHNTIRSESKEQNITADPVENGSSNNEDLSNIVNATLLNQIKQAIAASLPAHPSVNKDEINKSVDAALQNFMENMNKGQTSVINPDDTMAMEEPRVNKKKVTKKLVKRRSSMDKATALPNSMNGTPTKADKHPKKVWACKHHDTETVPRSQCASKDQPAFALNPSLSKKRGPGRPRKGAALTTAQKQSLSTNQSMRFGKVPTASATVMPLKRRPGSLSSRVIQNCSKPGLNRPSGRIRVPEARFTSAEENSVSGSSPEDNVIITRDKAIKSTDTVCSSKSLQSKMRSGHYRDVPDPSIYDGTSIGEHLMEAIDVTVDKYSWDKKFEEACHDVEREMNFCGEIDGSVDKRKLAGPKKSIELVIEKLKNKQAQTIHSAASALLQLQDTQSQMLEVEGHQENGSEIIESQGSNFIQKRPRGRPRKHPITEDNIELPPKRPKLSLSEAKHSSKKHRILSKETKSKAKWKDSNSAKRKSDVCPTLPTQKSYLQAGLYSSTFKKNESSNTENGDHHSDSEEEPRLFPAPLDAGLHLRSLQKDFQLPYDIWWMYKHKKITASQNPSLQYVKINKNVYVGPRPALNLGEHICTCKPPQDGSLGCGRQCLNRLMYIECSATSCPCGDRCSNQVIQKSQWCQTLKRIKTTDRGWGVSSTERIPEGSFILEYVGEVLGESEFRMRTIELYHAYNDHYCVQLDSQTVIDGYRLANEGRYVNHSCEPNCEMLKWCVNGEYRICLFARHEIKPNEELTYDYNFHAYNMDQQQECRCGSKNCRGIIGGKAQRSQIGTGASDGSVAGTNTSQTKYGKTNNKQSSSNKGKGTTNQQEEKKKSNKEEDMGIKEFSILQMKPLTSREQDFIRIRQLFLIRNLSQVRKKEEQQQRTMAKRTGSSGMIKSSSKSKSKKTNKEEREKLDDALFEMYTAIATCKDQNGVSVAIPFMNLPSKKKNPEYYERISDPIDLSVIEHNLVDKQYQDIESFHSDVQRVFKNAEKYHGRKSTLGKDVARLRKAYANARGSVMLHLNGSKKQGKTNNVSDSDEDNENIHRKNEDYIRCICCIYKDEGLMVQCEKCYVWQHCDCMGVKPGNMDQYLCEECDPRPISKEVRVIPPPPNSPPGHTYYVTLLREDLLIKQGDCVYLMKDHRLRNNSNMPTMRANRNLASISQEELNIFRIQKLWTDERGDKYAYGQHFLRPHETHHAPSRTFYHNELFASPFNEIIPLEAIVDLCMVMDLYTYCKGKPKGFKIQDVFICDFRVDKAASLFTRITKKKYPICTKPHVFDTYKNKICPKKDFQPHQVPEHYKKSSGRPSAQISEKLSEFTDDENSENGDEDRLLDNEEGEESNSVAGENRSGRWKKRQRLNGIAHKLLSKLPKQAVDVSYLLEPGSGKRHRKKTLLSLESLSQQK